MNRLSWLLAIATAVALMAIGTTLALATAMRERGRAERAEASISAATGGLTRTMAADSLEVATRAAQYRTIEELKQERADLLAEIDNLGVARRRAEAVTRVAQSARRSVRLDTVRIVETDTIRDTITVRTIFTHSDPWLSARVEGDSLHLATRDSLTIVTHSKRRKFLWWTWNKYSGRVSVHNANPYVTIAAVETINIEK